MSVARSAIRRVVLLFALVALLGAVAPSAGAQTPGTQSAMVFRTATVSVDGVDYTLDIGMSAAAAARVTGPIRVAVTSTGRASLGTTDAGFNDRGYRVSSARGRDAATVTFRVTIPARGTDCAEVGVSSAAGGAVSVPATANVVAVIVAYR